MAYAASKFILALMYGRSWREYAQYRSLSSHYAAFNGIIGLLWLAIALVAPTNFWLWGLVVGIDVFTPLLIRWSHQARGKPEVAYPLRPWPGRGESGSVNMKVTVPVGLLFADTL